jgi:hypothetical protein
MKTLQDAMRIIANQNARETWSDLASCESVNTIIHCLKEAAELYASQYKSEVKSEEKLSLLQEQLRLSEENNKVLLEKLKGGEETENNGEMEDYINITFSLNIDTFNRFLKALKCGDPELWAEIKDDIKEHLEDACKRAKLKPHQSN